MNKNGVDKYLIAIRLWKTNWEGLATFFKYPPKIRKIIYTTNAMESYNRQLRKVTKTKSIFSSDDALLKMLYLATMDISKKWTQAIRGWAQIYLYTLKIELIILYLKKY